MRPPGPAILLPMACYFMLTLPPLTMITRTLTLIQLICFTPFLLHATVFTNIPDETLLNQSEMVISGTVLDSRCLTTHHSIETIYRIRVEDTHKGFHQDVISVAVPGGQNGDGIGLTLFGAPVFTAGEEVILFLQPNHQAPYTITQFVLGAFHIVEVDGRFLAVRDLSQATEFSSPGQVAKNAKVQGHQREAQRFKRWLSEIDNSPDSEGNYWTPIPPPAIPLAKFRHFGVRWQEFDLSRPVYWQANASGQQGVVGGGFTEFRQALSTWNDEDGSTINYVYSGTGSDSGGLIRQDYQNSLLFNDPNDEIPGSYDCTTGGILAIGGFFSYGVHSYKGQLFSTIIEGDILTQDGAGCVLGANNGANAAEILAHELGHTLGLDHSGDSSALMFAMAHGDGRGAYLGHDDQAGVRYLYDSFSPAAPMVPSGLSASDGTEIDRVAVHWSSSAEADTYRLYRSATFNDMGSPVYSGTATSYDDLTAQPGIPYYYSVMACSDDECSNLTIQDSGFRQGSVAAPETPVSLTASDNAHEDRVVVRWSPSEGAFSYRLNRSTTPGDAGSPIYSGDSSEYLDFDIQPGVFYYYSIVACNDFGCSEPSDQESGRSRLPSQYGALRAILHLLLK